MNLDGLKEVLGRVGDGRATTRELAEAVSFAIDEIDYLRRFAQAYKETAQARATVAQVARTLSEHTDRCVDDQWQGPTDEPASCWLVSDDDMIALRAALAAWKTSP